MSCLWNKKKEVAVRTHTPVFRMRISSASGYGSSTRYFGQDVPIRRQDRRGNSMSSLRIPDFKSESINEFKLPELGENIAQGDLVRLMISLGASVTEGQPVMDRKSTRLNSSHLGISYAVFC